MAALITTACFQFIVEARDANMKPLYTISSKIGVMMQYTIIQAPFEMSLLTSISFSIGLSTSYILNQKNKKEKGKLLSISFTAILLSVNTS